MQTMPERYSFGFVESNPAAWRVTDRDRVLQLLWHRVVQPMVEEALKASDVQGDIAKSMETWKEYNSTDDEGLLLFLASGEDLLYEAENMEIVSFVGRSGI